MKRGKYIVVVGGEGTGKDTLIECVNEFLSKAGHQVVLTKEPGGTKIGKKFRSFLLDEEGVPAIGEAFLFLTDRVVNISSVVLPALEAGKIVLQNRGDACTIAYQQASGFSDIDFLKKSNKKAMQGISSDLYILLDAPPQVGLQRKKYAGMSLNNFDKRSMEYHEAVRANYLAQAETDPEHWSIIDASKSEDDVCSDACHAIQEKLGL